MARKPRKSKKPNGAADGAVFDQTAAGAQDAGTGPQGDPGSAGIGDNSQAIATAVDEAKTNIRQHNADRTALLEQAAAIRKQAASIGKKIADEYRKIKMVSGIDRKQMEWALQLEDMEPEAREKALQQQALAYHFAGLTKQFADAYAAAAPGEQIDFLKATDSEPRQEPEHIDVKTARAAGRQAGQNGKAAGSNPHGVGSDLHAAWSEGWLEGTADNLPEAGTPAPAAEPGDPFGPGEEATA